MLKRAVRPLAALGTACIRVLAAALHSPYSVFRRRRTARALAKLGVFHKCYGHSLSTPNDAWRRWGYGPNDMNRDNWLSALHPEDAQWVLRELNRQLSEGDEIVLPEYRIFTSTGEQRWILSKGVVASRDKNGEVKSYFGIDFDITRSKETQHQLARTKKNLEARLKEIQILRKAGSVITSTLDREEVVRRVLDQAKQMLPYDRATVMELDGNVLRIVNGWGWEQPEEVRGLEIPHPGESPHSVVLRNRKPLIITDTTRYLSLFRLLGIEEVRSWLGIPLVVGDNRIGVVAFDTWRHQAFTPNHMRLGGMLAEHIAVAMHNARRFERKKAEASTDPLTEVYNRRRWYKEAQRYVERAVQSAEPFSLLMMDLDYFKDVNDTYGHAVGDTILRSVSGLCRQNLRPFDLLGRYGGEEFILILPGTRKGDALSTAERLRQGVHTQLKQQHEMRLSISIGIASYPEDSEADDGIDSYIRMADSALYGAKRKGRNRVELYQPPRHTEAAGR